MTERLKRHTVPINKVTVHYTAIKKNPNLPIERKLKGLFRFSANDLTQFKKQLWGDIPYNYYIDMNGQAAEGRSPDYIPDTNTSYNPDGHVTIVVEGDATDDVSPAQKAKLNKMVKALQDKYNIPPSGVNVHNHYATTSCPGPALGAAMQEYRVQNANYRPNRQACLGGVPPPPTRPPGSPKAPPVAAPKAPAAPPTTRPPAPKKPGSGSSFMDDGEVTR